MKLKILFAIALVVLILGCGGKDSPYDEHGGNGGHGGNSPDNSEEDVGLPDGTKTDDSSDIDGKNGEDLEQDPEWSKQDDDGDGIPNGVEGTSDADGDGTPNYLDDDSDGDGIPDKREAPNGVAIDDDEDGIPNYRDDDSDGDGIPDSVEGTEDFDGDGVPNYRDDDSDNDGIFDTDECYSLPCIDSDNDGEPDYLDTDSDNDGISDFYEGLGDADKDGIPNFLDDDSDNDGMPDADENQGIFPPLDTDGDGTPDFLDFDSDGDGLSDEVEIIIGSDPKLPDSDGDGFDDNSEFILGSDPNDPASMISEDAFYVMLPYNGEPVAKTLNFSTKIQKVDVLILVDLSGSMGEEHANLKEGIKSTIIDGVRSQISDSAFGLVNFGTLESKTYSLAQPITMDADAVKSAVDGISESGGSEEYHNLALWAAASGEYKYENVKIPGDLDFFHTCVGASKESVTINPPDCSAYPGNIGGACFRPESLPIFIMASDESFTDDDWCGWESGSRTTRDMAIEKMNAINAKFIGLDSGSSTSDFNYISDGTGSNDGAGTRFNFTVNADGTGFSQAIVDAVVSLTNNIQIDIAAKAKHVANDFGVEDTSKFVKSISPESFQNVKPGQEVTFDITFENDFYKNESYESKVFTATISVLGDGAFLDTRDVIIVVPGIDYVGGNQ
ncbi:hypothetical protein J6Z19_01700 [bacterium]|nr:hypothetical protein [bacterium]